jgi:hypothetical protein
MRCVALATSMGKIRYANKIFASDVKGTLHLRDLGVNRKISNEPVPVHPQLILSRV